VFGQPQRATAEQVQSLRPEWKEGKTVRWIDTSASSSDATAAIWVEHRNHPGLMFRLELDGAGGVVSFTVRPAMFTVTFEPIEDRVVAVLAIDERSVSGDSPRLTASLMRTIPLDQLRVEATSGLTLLLRAVGSDDLPEPKRYRRSSLTDLDLARFAKDWVDLVHKQIRNPAEVLQERIHLSYNGVIYRRRRAVERGLLTGSIKQGVTGGAALTEKAELILAEATTNGDEI
jgi:hypothetical protein